MNIYTTTQYDEAVWQPVKTIYVTHTEAVSLLRGIVGGITGLIGGEQIIMNKKIDDVTEALMKKVQKMIDGRNQCIMGLNIQLTEFGRQASNTTISGLAIGTLLQRVGTAPRNTTRRRAKG